MVKRILLFIVGILTFAVSQAHDGPALRRVISPSQPVWIIHIDTWNAPNPQAIINMVPEDIKPYVVFNLSLSATESICPDGKKVVDSWMKVCAENRVWTMIQPASGGCSAFDDDDLELYESYYKNYPNFLGWNYAEQFWGFDEDRKRENGTIHTPSFLKRLELFTHLMKFAHQYGGYLCVSFTQACYSANMMPVAYMKRNAEMNRLLSTDKEHFICCEKYTMKNGFYDIESNCLGAYLGGYAGQYGIRFDICGWMEEQDKLDENGNAIKDPSDASKFLKEYYNDFPKACGAIPILEHVALTGETVIDGPELVTTDNLREIATTKTADGYTRRNWAWFNHFKNINIDMFRKILDGTIRIPSREEVIARTKICVKNDIKPKNIYSSQNEMEPYVSPGGLYDGLYRSEQDDNGTQWPNSTLNNKWWLKVSGRYPTIPVVYDLIDEEAKKLQVAIKSSEYANNATWSNVTSKKAYMNKLFKQEYTGDIYASRLENTWVCYNPYQYNEEHVPLAATNHGMKFIRKYWVNNGRSAKGTLKPAYNTCRQIKMNLAPYSLVHMREYSDKLSLYMQNYRIKDGLRYGVGDGRLQDDKNLPEYAQQTDTIIVVGASAQPTISWKDNSEHSASTVTCEWKNGQFTVYVKHNGPLELTIDNCKGTNTTGKLKDSDVTAAVIETPAMPEAYEGEMQYEFENFDYKNVGGCYGNAWNNGFRGYYGQGCLNLGTQKGASVRGYIPVTKPGNYKVAIRYQASAGDAVVKVICGNQTKQVTLPKNASSSKEWSEVEFDMDIADVKGNMTVNYVSGKRAVLDCVRLNYKGALTGIAGVTTDADMIDHVEYYDLQGMRLSAAKQGVSIKKVYLRSGKTYTEKIYK